VIVRLAVTVELAERDHEPHKTTIACEHCDATVVETLIVEKMIGGVCVEHAKECPAARVQR
jgi:hypothetical protein